MKKNGFTLIELLAVIVILAIIALIATPIILGIINDAREESNERSVELYASAVRNGIVAYQLREGNEVLPGTYNNTTKKLPFEVEYDGEVDCTTVEIYEDTSVYLEGCTVNGGDKTYNYGTKQTTQVYKPQYYYFGYDWKGIVGETAAPENPSSVPPTGKNFYLGYDVTDGVVSAAYACFIRNDTEYCLKATTDGSTYETNKAILEDAYADVVDTDACDFEGGDSNCFAGGLHANADSDGEVLANSYGGVNANGGSVACEVLYYGYFECYEP